MLSSLSERVYDFLQGSDQAHTSAEIAAALLGLTGRYARILAPDAQEAACTVQEAAHALVESGRLRSAVTYDGAQRRIYYAKRI